MAVVPTGEIFKTLTFDGQSSGDYGVYITGEAVYNAPARDVEMVTIPGRNGQFALDKGRFENIEVTYPAGIFADNEADFAQAVSDFRNFLASRSGYCRLEDDYNSNEYRMAVYKSGLEVDPKLLRAGEFNIVFDCKPQRWLKSGETAVSVESGDTLTNPTPFESSPLLEIDGTGEIQFNNYSIGIETLEIGDIELAYTRYTNKMVFDDIAQKLNEGDEFTTPSLFLVIDRYYEGLNKIIPLSNDTTALPDGWGFSTVRKKLLVSHVEYLGYAAQFNVPTLTFEYGTASYQDAIVISQIRASLTTDDTATWTDRQIVRLHYDGADTLKAIWNHEDGRRTYRTSPHIGSFNGNVIGHSSKAYDYGTIFCDTDIGEFYRIEGGEYISMNHVGDLGSDLPTLASGENTVTYDNTITELNIAPRWWKI